MLQFTERKELSQLIRALSSSKYERSTYFKLSGKSGSGKTELLKKAVDTIVKSDMLYIYIDIVPDDFLATSFFPLLLETVYLPLTHRYNTVTNIPENFALAKYIKKIFKMHTGFEKFFDALTLSTSTMSNWGGPVSAVMEKWMQERTTSIDNMLFLYFKYLIKKTRINLIIDNYQFLPAPIKRVLEIGVNQFNNGVTLFVIECTTESFRREQTFCTSFYHDFLDLNYMPYEQFEELIEKQNIRISNEQTRKIWEITKGNLKDVDIMLNELRINPGYDIASNKIAIQNLDTIQRSILLIAALFPAGMKEGFVIQFIRNIISETENEKIEKAIIGLVELGYIYINSNTHDTIKPSHETVINHVKEMVDMHDLADFCSKLSASMEELAESYHGTKDYSYLLHCWIGLNSSEQLRKKTGAIQDLISIKFKENEYYYIDAVATSIPDVITYLPENTIEKILISFQRVSDFSSGKNILNSIRLESPILYNKFRIFYIKFLIQTYEFEDALEELNNMPSSSQKLLCQTNALQHLGQDREVEELLNTELKKCNIDENYYIILRNTAHFFEYESAKKNLMQALDFFCKKKYMPFAVATIQNNLAVINIWKEEYEEADCYLKYSIKALEGLCSNEVFEPYCNKSILCLLQHEYDKAYQYAHAALAKCPKSLALDIMMLNVNMIVIELCQNILLVEDALKNLKNLAYQFPLIDDPWYEFQLLYNQKQLAALIQQDNIRLAPMHERYITEYQNSKTKFYIIKSFSIQGFQVKLCLGLSPNWRY